MKNSFATGNVDITITDIIGRKLLSQTAANNTIAEISIAGLQKGVYIVTVSNKNASETKKIVKQ